MIDITTLNETNSDVLNAHIIVPAYASKVFFGVTLSYTLTGYENNDMRENSGAASPPDNTSPSLNVDALEDFPINDHFWDELIEKLNGSMSTQKRVLFEYISINQCMPQLLRNLKAMLSSQGAIAAQAG